MLFDNDFLWNTFHPLCDHLPYAFGLDVPILDADESLGFRGNKADVDSVDLVRRRIKEVGAIEEDGGGIGIDSLYELREQYVS